MVREVLIVIVSIALVLLLLRIFNMLRKDIAEKRAQRERESSKDEVEAYQGQEPLGERIKSVLLSGLGYLAMGLFGLWTAAMLIGNFVGICTYLASIVGDFLSIIGYILGFVGSLFS